jgi:antirestriction protein ArdC
VKQLEIREDAEGGTATRLVPMMRKNAVFNVDRCDGLPDNVKARKPARVRNPDTREDLADEFLRLGTGKYH